MKTSRLTLLRSVTQYSIGTLVCAAAISQPALGQVPRTPDKEVVLEHREFPIPFRGYNQAYVNVIAFSKDGSLLATGAEAHIVVWDIETRKIATRMQLPDKQYAVNLAFTDDGKTLVSNGHDDPMIRFWDVKTGRQKSEHPHSNAPKMPLPPRQDKEAKEERGYRNPFVAFGPGARLMAAYDAGFGSIGLVNTTTGALESKLDKSGTTWRGSWAISADGKYVANSSTWQPSISIWDAQTGELVRTMDARDNNKKARKEGYTNLRFSHDAKFVFAYYGGTGQNDFHAAIFSVDDGLECCRIPVWCYHMEISPDGRAIVGASGGRFFLFDLLADKLIDNVKLPAQHFYHVQRSPDGLTLALLGGGGTVNSDSVVYLAPFPLLGDDAIPQGKLSAADESDLWTGLASPNLFRRRYVAKVLKAHADQAAALVEARVKPAPEKRRQRVLESLKQLDDDDFERRDVAMKTLTADAFHFEPLLRQTLESSSSGEVRNRVTFILNGIKDQSPPGDLLADLRGIELLQTLPSPAAQKLMEALAAGAAGARTSEEARSAVQGLKK